MNMLKLAGLTLARQKAMHTGLPIALASVACCAIHLVAKAVEASCYNARQSMRSAVSDWGHCCFFLMSVQPLRSSSMNDC